MEWAAPGGEVGREVVAQTERCLATYRTDAKRLREDANGEATFAQGGYRRKQLHELMQNATDAMAGMRGGRIEVVLTADTLYVANEGEPFTVEGVQAVMAAHLSQKDDEKIGQFGLGFKSVVAISDSPAVLSRSGSFVFDRAYSRQRIAEVIPNAQSYPVLRIARTVDPHDEAERDEILVGLMRWATTIVKVPFTSSYAELSEDLRTFPAQFVLFSPHIVALEMYDEKAGLERKISVSDLGDGTLRLSDGGDTSDWRVARRVHSPSRAALVESGFRGTKERVTVSWAVPMRGRSALGSFWAFFPTEDRTTLSGIVNAPWKLSEDRRNILNSRYNREILTEVLPSMMSAEWARLYRRDDPGALLDILPARGKEPRSWADDVLNEPVMRQMQAIACVPDASGRLSKPTNLRAFPSNLPKDACEIWESTDPVPAGWSHSTTVTTPERRAKLERLVGASRVKPSVCEWVEAVTSPPRPERSAAAIEIVRSLRRSEPSLAHELARARIVLLEGGRLAPARAGQAFIRSTPDERGDAFIDPDLARRAGVVRALQEIGVSVRDRAGDLRSALAAGHVDWTKIWKLAEACDMELAVNILRDELPSPIELSLRVRNKAGRFVPLGGVLLPGTVIKPSSSGDRDFAVDVAFHRGSLDIIKELGGVSQPCLRRETPPEAWLRAYEDLIKQRFIDECKGAKPNADKLVAEGPMPPWPLDMLSRLSEDARVELTTVALAIGSSDTWTVRHQANQGYGIRRYKNPLTWWLHKHGRLMTEMGPMPLNAVVRAGSAAPADVVPTVDLPAESADELGIACGPDELSQDTWSMLLEQAKAWEPKRRWLLYAWAALYVEAPQRLLADKGGRPHPAVTTEVAVVSADEDFRSLQDQHVAAIIVPDEDVEHLIEAWGMENGKALLDQDLVYQPAGEAMYLTDRYPQLRLWDVDPEVKLQLCDSIELVMVTNQGSKSRTLSRYREGEIILSTAREDKAILRDISDLSDLGMDASDIRRVLDQMMDQEAAALRAQVQAASTVEAKLALLIGDEGLVRHVPVAALRAVAKELGHDPSGAELAHLVLAVHGVEALQLFKNILEERRLNPPRQWAGKSIARRFVTDLGFPVEFAGFASEGRPAAFSVDGPAVLKPLHDYQTIVTSKIKAMLRGSGPARGMVSLPTGAGKTRVAVQALVEEIKAGVVDGPIVWIAQSEELCEQAIETWAYIWRAVGPEYALPIGRLWDTFEVEELATRVQLIVATPNKLLNCVAREQYQWLTETSVVVVDEAHTSVATMYTQVLEWLGRGRSRRERRPLIGLTATPFRNTNVDQTERLVNRYDKNRLDAGAFPGDPYRFLQGQGVLAQVEHELLEGADVELSPQEREEIRSRRLVPQSVGQRLGNNASRNETIVSSIASLSEDWTALVFASSVDNARVLASLLSYRGIPSMAISGDTNKKARRHYIDEFRRGRIRVITNYGVLTQGFDAPAVRAVYVTRPTFSANLYQQMIGRGLRGPLNGGSEMVRIVNVADTFKQFGEALAFTEFEYLWSGR